MRSSPLVVGEWLSGVSFNGNFANLMMARELGEQVAEGCLFIGIETGEEL